MMHTLTGTDLLMAYPRHLEWKSQQARQLRIRYDITVAKHNGDWRLPNDCPSDARRMP